MEIIGVKDFKIVLNKFLKGFLYSLVVFFAVIGMTWIQGGGLPPLYAVYGSLIYGLLESFLKFFKQYKPDQYDEFKWFYDTILKKALKSFKK